jgi:hypothetical protein
MAIRVIAAAVLSAFVMFVWGFVFWALSGAPTRMFSPLPESAQADVTAVLRRERVPSGVYVYPMPANPGDADAAKANEELFRAGPRFFLAHRLEGGEPMGGVTLGAGFGHMLAVALVAAVITAMAIPALGTFGRRFTFVAMLGLLGSLWTSPGDVVWWNHSTAYCLGQIAYGLVAGLLMAAVIAAILRPRSTGSAAT